MENKVSVIMPVFNAEKYISEAIRSVLDQEHGHWELLIVNDGSTDGSEQIIQTFDDPRIKYFQQANQGVSAARNTGLQAMQGDYFCFLDADDLMTPKSLSSRLALFAKPDENVAYVTGGQQQMDKKLQNVLLIQVPHFTGNPKSALKRLDPKCFINCGTWLIKRIPDYHYAFRTSWTHAEDLAFFFEISDHGILLSTPEIAQVYRRNDQSAMSDLDGLKDGYLKFFKLVRAENDTTWFEKYFLQLKIMKIMTLSYLHKRQFKAILSSTLEILKT